MNLFQKRPLALILFVIVGGFSLFALTDAGGRALTALLALAAAVIFFVLPRPDKQKRKIFALSLVFLFLLSGLLSSLYFDLFFDAEKKLSGECDVAGVVERVETNENATYLDLKTETANGKSFKNRKIRVTFYFATEKDIVPGDELHVYGEVGGFGSSDTGFDFDTYYHARGYSGAMKAEALTVTGHRDGERFLSAISSYRAFLSQRAATLSDSSTGAFLSAVLLGERGGLDGRLKLGFSRLGISHLLAISGMHLAILSGIFDKILKLLRTPRVIRSLFTAVFSAFYMFLTGFPPSVMRAGIMLILSSLLFIFERSKDSVTNLSIALFVIVCVFPYSVRDISLWLSVFATFGMCVAGERRAETNVDAQEKPSLPHRAYSAFRASVYYSFFAIAATASVSALLGKNTSILSPLSTFFFGILVEIFLFLGILVLLVGKILPIGGLLTLFYRLISDATAALSSVPWCFVYTGSPASVVFLILSTAVFFAFAILKIKHKRIAVAVLFSLLLSFFVSSLIATAVIDNEKNILYSASSGDDLILLSENGETVLYESTDLDSSTAYRAADLIAKSGHTEIDTLVFSGYSENMKTMLDVLTSRVLVRRVALPMPLSDDEIPLAKEAVDFLDDARVEPFFYDPYTKMKAGSLSLLPAIRTSLASGRRASAAVIVDEDRYIGYFSKGIFENDEKAEAEPIIGVSQTLIFGCHGSSNSDEYMPDIGEITELVVLSNDKIRFHPEGRNARYILYPDVVDLTR